ncbi:MAG: NAD(P)/FAD-dependent oxidoreductase [Rubrivivax sp.]|nr:MAG: NAD(P)/FAD-dependent oxidoreductase [Rubrivivax sp.]
MNFSADVCFVGLPGGNEELRSQLREAGVRELPGRPTQLVLGPAGDVTVQMDDGAGHRFDVLYAALGVDPCVALAAGLGARLDEQQNVVTDAHGRTSVDGLYAAGDVVSGLDQIGVAVGQAAIAATAIHNSL